MSATDPRKVTVRRVRQLRQDGIAAVEFALIAVMFFLIIFGILELARILYMYNTLPEVTASAARAAANIDFRDTDALNAARRRAIFDETSGRLPFGDPVTFANLHIDYMYFDQGAGQLKHIATTSLACPAQVRQNCLTNRAGSSCVRAVRVRVCKSGGADGTCERLDYQMLFPLVNLGVPLPISATIVAAESLGYRAGDPICPAG